MLLGPASGMDAFYRPILAKFYRRQPSAARQNAASSRRRGFAGSLSNPISSTRTFSAFPMRANRLAFIRL